MWTREILLVRRIKNASATLETDENAVLRGRSGEKLEREKAGTERPEHRLGLIPGNIVAITPENTFYCALRGLLSETVTG